MKNAMSLVVRASVIGIAIVGASSCAQTEQGAQRGSKKLVPAIIFLTPTGVVDAPCLAKVAPGRLQVKKNEDADWTIIDLCGGTKNYTLEVELRWSSSNPDCGGRKSPLDPAEGDPKGQKSIKRGIDSRCTNGDVFAYEVWLEGKPLADPELEIAM